ncbi:MAG: hypothetical protein Q9220_007110 [cf. Caloplaca sp. 1 TL-2023]
MQLWIFWGAVALAYVNSVPGHQQVRRQSGPIPPDTIEDCTYFYESQPGDTCASIAVGWGLTLEQFKTYNPSVKSDCSGLVIGNAYCVEENYGNGPADPETTSTTTSKTTSATIAATPTGPTPVQSGISSQCKNFYKIQDGDTCAGIVDKYHTFTLQNLYIPPNYLLGSSKTFYKVKDGDECGKIVASYGTFSLTDFYTWNPAIGMDCAKLISGYYVCVGLPSTPTTRSSITSTSTSPAPTGPSPTQSGIISSCTKYYKAVSGDDCEVISNRYGTCSVAQFVSWNPAVKSECSQLFLQYYYCIAVPGTPTTRTTTRTTSKTPTPTPKGPQPQQPGIVADCNKYYLVKSGDSCYSIQQSQRISSGNFLKWNTGVKSDCSNLFMGYYICTGVS